MSSMGAPPFGGTQSLKMVVKTIMMHAFFFTLTLSFTIFLIAPGPILKAARIITNITEQNQTTQFNDLKSKQTEVYSIYGTTDMFVITTETTSFEPKRNGEADVFVPNTNEETIKSSIIEVLKQVDGSDVYPTAKSAESTTEKFTSTEIEQTINITHTEANSTTSYCYLCYDQMHKKVIVLLLGCVVILLLMQLGKIVGNKFAVMEVKVEYLIPDEAITIICE